MINLKRVKITTILASSMLLASILNPISSSAHKYYYNYDVDFIPKKQVDGISSNVSYTEHASDYFHYKEKVFHFESAYHQAMEEWNAKTEAYILDHQTYGGLETVRLKVAPAIPDGYQGFAEFYRNGSLVSVKISDYPKALSDWNLGVAYVNPYYLRLADFKTYKAVAVHEIGHVLGLAHESGTSIMNPDYSTQSVQQDDINGVNNLY
ncbi:matrixin family metalloprotease [Paenibacillus agilis]|uniref:Matrixin family metalloprotease n=1 Tax=Paenibacillus agilis TaxID=3020863 RepID=A0A559J1K9_9BACL|nr:matrixin family metalloprotease [Paenibacillus agilis]TVX93731.1 matrixin family metalloprotease [Paenibacillus agilis]